MFTWLSFRESTGRYFLGIIPSARSARRRTPSGADAVSGTGPLQHAAASSLSQARFFSILHVHSIRSDLLRQTVGQLFQAPTARKARC
jgi:hypothetical protein